MDPKYEKDTKEVDSGSVGSEPRRVEFYDPSKESAWTRAGLTFESFKRAPGTTGYVHTIQLSRSLPHRSVVVKLSPVPTMLRTWSASWLMPPCCSRR